MRALLCSCLIVISAATVWMGDCRRADAQPANRTLLPEQTQAFVEILDVPRFKERWDQSFAGAICNEPELQPFFEMEKESIRQRLKKAGITANLTLDDIATIASGNALLACFQLSNSNAVAVMVDTRGRDKQFAEVMQKIDAQLKQQRGATIQEETYLNHPIKVYTLAKKIGQIHAQQFCYVRVDGRFIGSDQLEGLKLLLDHLSGNGDLIKSKSYTSVEAKIGVDADDDLQWFVKPFGLARIVKARGGGLKKQQLDLIELLHSQGFDAILAAGGRLRLNGPEYDLRHTSYIYAPPTTSEPSKYKLAGRMLQFSNRPQNDPPAWVPVTIASYLDGNWNMSDAFWAAESLVNEAVGDKIFRRVIDGIKKDRDGPQIDLANDVIANLKQRILLLTDNTKPITKQSERMLIAVELNNPLVVKAAVDKAMKTDPNAKALDYPGHDWIWQVTRPEASDDEIELEGFRFEDFDDIEGDDEDNEDDDDKKPLLNQWAITVYGDYLMFSSHSEMLVETIDHDRNRKPGDNLLSHADFKRLVTGLKEASGDAEYSVWRALQPRLSLAVKYELFRRGELKDSDSVLAALVRRATLHYQYPQEGEVKVDTSKLPEFDVVQKHLQPSGTAVTTEADGWKLHSIILKPAAKP